MACALIGAAIGGGWSMRVPDRYVSSAVIRIADGADVQDLQRAQTAILSRGSLAELIVKDDLFHDERMTIPMEDVIDEVRNKHIRVRPLATAQKRQLAATPPPFEISFEYPDRTSPQKFTRALTGKFAAAVPAIQILDDPSLPAARLPEPPHLHPDRPRARRRHRRPCRRRPPLADRRRLGCRGRRRRARHRLRHSRPVGLHRRPEDRPADSRSRASRPRRRRPPAHR